ncbi:TonB-dependent receptor [Novosphingobium sp. FKTRR1]|uniref:TonB-dependent receptor n=1 Tax=unclassified Novosphingobium TaxID=2644732 RepID=UPI001CF087F6|nr:TonB-dependent receptor [Novosphingobium sp. FKTRR1]
MRTNFKTATSLAGIAIALACGPTVAQAQVASTAAAPAEETDAIVVTGLRKSLADSVNIKRNTQGVVDAITSEDIGKLPDTNLAESIQRIPGVSIDRANNEGSRVTVRGFGPEFNLVTLNGRSMPGSGVNGTRSFDFANISADGVSGIDVFKTGRADVASGGIGSTIDIHTARPFDFKDFKASLQAKATDDTSKSGFHLTPEVSGLVSNTFADGRIGLLLNGSYSERDSQLQSAYTRGWLDNVDLGTAKVVNNNKNPSGNYWAPQDANWAVENHHRTRLNGQAVLQFKPTDTLVGTIDYTYALYKDHALKNSFGAWFGYGGSLTSATIDGNGTMTNLVDAGSDLSYTGTADNQRNELSSLGGNLKWQPLDNLTIVADGHHSVNTSTDDAQFYIVGQDQNYSIDKIFDSTKTGIPTTTWTFKSPHNVGNLDTSLITPLFGQHNFNRQRTAVDEGRLETEWRNNGDSGLRAIKVGVDYKSTQTAFTVYNSGNISNGYYDPRLDGKLPSSLFTKVSSSSILSGLSGGGKDILVPYFYSFDPLAVSQALAGLPNYNGTGPAPSYPAGYGYGTVPTTDNLIKERTFAGYAQLQFDGEFNSMRFKAQAGVRYEHTSVTAASLQQTPVSVTWNNPTEFQTQFQPGAQVYTVKKSYDDFLPSIDASLQITSKLIARASYSKTITRSDLNSLVSTQVVNANPHVGNRTISAGNPGLLPYTSQNFDLTFEYYIKNNSYFSVNFFTKQVSNFLTQTTTTTTLPGLTDASLGAIAQKATAEVLAAGQQASAQNVFAQMVADTGKSAFVGQPGDPLIVWQITQPSNANTVNIHGFEIAGQYVFGDTGFGVQANVSLPAGGARYNNAQTGIQFALPGLSKSYNLVAFYEKHGFQTRLAWTHRGAFLSALSQPLYANEPTYTASYGQLDGSASYDVTPQATVFVDAVNILGAHQNQYGRYSNQFVFAAKGYGRYQAGLRVKF